jgi:hypothetical protein
MAKSKEPKIINVIALHDLSYVNHLGEPQYRRQSSRPFEMDETTAKQFLERQAIEIVKVNAPLEAADPVDDFADAQPIVAQKSAPLSFNKGNRR